MHPRADDLRVYNTLTREKEPFETIEEGKVRMYVCGPTVYDHCHIGHGRSYVAFDVIRRYLEFLGYDVRYVVNFTDVEDKVFERAGERGMESLELAEEIIDSFFEDMEALGVKRADAYPRVSEVVDEVIEVVEDLVEKGYGYQADGDVYYRVENFEDFGKLSQQKIEDLIAGKRVEVSEKKENPLDFALWKATEEDEDLSWESPWGEGRPGWHIECSVMAMTELGEKIDVHGGGQDLVFPHHESEIMQSEAFTGEAPFCRFWMHNGFITIDEEKMSKSLGNFYTIKEVLEQYPSEIVRFFLVNKHYRKPIDFSDEHLEEAREGYERLKNARDSLQAARRATEGADASLQKRLAAATDQARDAFHDAMLDDFNTRDAIAALFTFAGEVNDVLGESIHLDEDVLDEASAVFEEAGGILGIFEETAVQDEIVDDLVQTLIDVRAEARDRGEYDLADEIRDQLEELGILLEDRQDGTVWKWA